MFAPKSGQFLVPFVIVVLLLLALPAAHVIPLTFEYEAVLVLAFVFLVFFLLFFRDPERRPGEGIVAAADGRVLGIGREGERVRIATFMNVTDVHVNRFPIGGRVEAIETTGEGFRPAYHPDALHNLQRRYTLSTSLGPVDVIQMTGMVAKRLVSYVGVGEVRSKGDRLGMIALGSRVDVLLPAERVRVLVRVGDRVRAGRTSLAEERP